MTGARKVRVPVTQQRRPFVLDLLWIKQQRPEWTLAQLAYEVGVDRSTLYRWFRGQAEPNEAAVRQIKAVRAGITSRPVA